MTKPEILTTTRPRLPLTVVGILIPLLVSVVGIVVALVGLPQRSEIAVHWSLDGTPDGYAPPWTVVAGMALLAIVGPLAFGLPLVATRRDGVSTTQKFLAAASGWFATFLVVLGCWLLLTQRVPGEPAPIGVGLLLAAAAGVVVGAVGWWLTPPVVPVPPAGIPATPLPLGATERAVWIGRAKLATPGVVAISLAIAFSAVAGVIVAITTDGRVAAVLLVPVVLLVALLMTSFWAVRVDDAGLTVRSAAGWPRFAVPAAEIATAGTTEVRALGEFGGWGIRFGRGRRLGIVMRSGAALEVQRRDGSALVVTVDDADTAAALLSTVAGRATASGDGSRG